MLKENYTRKKKETVFGEFLLSSLVIASLVGISMLVNLFVKDIRKPIRINSFISIDLNFNRGIGFGFLSNHPLMSFLLSSAIVLLIGWFFFMRLIKEKERAFSRRAKVGFFLLLGGALSNMIERIVYGRITDYIRIWWWPSFNLADSFITLGAFLIGFALLKKDKK